jgi:hypothetical protein
MKHLHLDTPSRLRSIAVIALLLLTSCATPPPTPAPSKQADTPTGATVSVAAPTVSPTESNPSAMNFQICLFKNVVAGDYTVLSLRADGSVEATGWNRLNQITSYKKGTMEAGEMAAMLRWISNPDIVNLNPEYDLYPLPENSQMVYEDIYYILDIQTGDATKTIIAHEQVMPQSMKEMIVAIEKIAERMPDSGETGAFLLAGSHQILGFKRRPIENSLMLTPDSLSPYPQLREAIARPYSLLSVQDLLNSPLGGILNEKQNSLSVLLEGATYDVLLLTRE